MSDAINWDSILSFENMETDMLHLCRDENTIQTKPTGEIKKIKTLSSHIHNQGGSWEKDAIIIGIVENNGKKYVRITDYGCYAGPNGRPCESLSEKYFPITSDCIENISVDNWKNHVKQKPAYHYSHGSYGTGEYINYFNSEYGEDF